VVNGDLVHHLKFDASAFPNRDRYETWAITGDAATGWVHHIEDASNDEPYSFTDTRWFPRQMRVGREYQFDDGGTTAIFKARDGACTVTNRVGFRSRAWILAAWDRFDCGPDLGVRQVVAVVFDPTDGVYAVDRGIEVNYFAAGAGWLRWEYHRSDVAMASGVPVFDNRSRTARSDFYRFGGTAWSPNLTGCAPMPTTTETTTIAITDYTRRGDAPLLVSVDYAITGPFRSGAIVVDGDTRVTLYERAGRAQFDLTVPGVYDLSARAYYDGAWVSTGAKRQIVVLSPPQPPVTPPPVPPSRPIAEGVAGYAQAAQEAKDALAAPVNTAVVKFPALMASYYAAITDPDLDVDAFANFLRDCGVTGTRTWLLDAWAIGEREADGTFKRGQYDGFLPVLRLPDGRFDLDQWNPAYFTRIRRFVEAMNQRGVFCHLTLLELYSWSDRKANLPFVPDVNRGMFRNNVNGVRWGGPDDPTFFSLPDPWLKAFIARVVQSLTGLAWLPEVGNEFPEKDLHWRMIDALREAGWTGEITVNRQEDTPGQYWNMAVGSRFDRIAIHNTLSLAYLDEEFEREAEAGRPTTFRAMWPLVDASRIILSSDGGGGNPKYLTDLQAVAVDTLQRGGSYEHQLALKRNRFFGDGTLRMADLEIDRAFLSAVAASR
jgi:hypothetical protein